MITELHVPQMNYCDVTCLPQQPHRWWFSSPCGPLACLWQPPPRCQDSAAQKDRPEPNKCLQTWVRTSFSENCLCSCPVYTAWNEMPKDSRLPVHFCSINNGPLVYVKSNRHKWAAHANKQTQLLHCLELEASMRSWSEVSNPVEERVLRNADHKVFNQSVDHGYYAPLICAAVKLKQTSFGWVW